MKLNPTHSQKTFSGEINDLFKENEQLRRENATLKEWLAIQGTSSSLPLTVDPPDSDRLYNRSDAKINLISNQLSDSENLNISNRNKEQYPGRADKISVESDLNNWQSSVMSDFLQKRILALEYLIHQQAQMTDDLNKKIQRITEIGTKILQTVQSLNVWLDLEKSPHLEESIHLTQNHPISLQSQRYLCLPISAETSLDSTKNQETYPFIYPDLLDIPIQNSEGELGFIRVNQNNLSTYLSEEERSFLECLANLVSLTLEQEKFKNREEKLSDQLNRSVQNLQLQTPAKNIDRMTSSANGNLLTHINHELRTPIHTILGYSDLLCEEMLEQGQVNWLQSIQTIRQKGYQLLQIVESISDLIRIESKQMSLNLELFDPVQIIQGVVESLIPIAEKNHHQLKIYYGRNLGLMHTDLSKLQKILHHLLKNALEFTEKSQFKLKICRHGTWIDFELTNSQIGETTQQQQYLLEAFTQASDQLSCKLSRTQLGLTICRSLCKMMGGEMKILGCCDRGLTFKVRLQAQLE